MPSTKAATKRAAPEPATNTETKQQKATENDELDDLFANAELSASQKKENPRTSFKINNLKPNFFSITTPHRHTLTVPSRLPASRIPAACGTVLQMALVIAARYSELPPESAAPPCVRGDRGRIQPIRSSLPSGAQPVADQLCSGLWAHKAPFLSCNWCLARVDVVFLLKFDVLTYDYSIGYCVRVCA